MQLKSRDILLVIAKAEEGFWPRLLQQKGRSASNIKIDWSKVRRKVGGRGLRSQCCCELIGEPIKQLTKLVGEPVKGRVKTGHRAEPCPEPDGFEFRGTSCC